MLFFAHRPLVSFSGTGYTLPLVADKTFPARNLGSVGNL